jgi:hypothetical protein
LNNAVSRAVDWVDQARAALDLHIRQHSCSESGRRWGGGGATTQP